MDGHRELYFWVSAGCCRCPISGSLHFYSSFKIVLCIGSTCVNALSRAPFISTWICWTGRRPESSVSMPYLGLPSFLRNETKKQRYGKDCVNALSRAPFISTPEEEELISDEELCQCPISGSLHFYVFTHVIPRPMKSVSMPYLGLPSFLQSQCVS